MVARLNEGEIRHATEPFIGPPSDRALLVKTLVKLRDERACLSCVASRRFRFLDDQL